jgi:signal transduction histidine kinase/ligand-binding sensor domain-containing protein/ActR/RegA family two-component response regulator
MMRVLSRKFGAAAVGSKSLFILSTTVLFSGMLYSAAIETSAATPGRIVRLPVIDRQDIRFARLPIDWGSLPRSIYSIAQDKYGFVWLGTHVGLYRYDGYSLKPYRHAQDDPNGLSDDIVNSVFKDRTGILWIGTGFGGLDRLDPARDTFTHYQHDPRDGGSLSSNTVHSVLEDRSGALWVATGGGLDRLDPANGTFVHYRHNPQDAGSLSNDTVLSLFEDRRGNLWVGTSLGLNKLGLNKLDRATGRFLRFLPGPRKPHGYGYDAVAAIREDHAGVLWLTIGGWLSALDQSTGKFTHYWFRSQEPGVQSIPHVSSIQEDQDEVLWLGTTEHGLLKLDRERTGFTRYLNDPANPDSLHHNFIQSIFTDTAGVLWVCASAGISRVRTKSLPFVSYKHEAGNPNSPRDNYILSVLTDSKGFLWIGSGSGLHRLDRKAGQLTFYQPDLRDAYSLSNRTVTAIREDRSGRLWFGTAGGGLNRFDPETGRFFVYHHRPNHAGSLTSDSISCLLVDRQGALWVGGTDGLNRFDPITENWTAWRHDPNNPHTLSHNSVQEIFEDRAGTLWLGTLDGLNRFDPKTEQFTVYRHEPGNPGSLSHNAVNAIQEDRQGTLWIGTDNGLNGLDRSRGVFTTLTTRDGLPENAIKAIQEDDRGYLWLATPNGLSGFHPARRFFRNYSELDGLPSNLMSPGWESGSYRSQDGEMFFGSVNGLVSFYPDRLPPQPYIPPVVLTDLQLIAAPMQQGENSRLRIPIWGTDSLTLTHQQRTFMLEFAALTFEAPGRTRYRYRLEGLETAWNEVDSKRRFVTYANLPPGKFVFRVQAAGNTGAWNEKGASVAITVLPPWWATWWFRSLAVLSILGLAFSAYQSRVRSLHQAAARLEVQVSERTHELQIAKDAAEAANRAKTTFLANMSHELRTPLNAILGFSNLLQDGNVSDRQRSDLGIINRSGEHLLHLIDEVLDVAKIEAGRGGLEIAPCGLTGMLRDVVDMMRERAQAKSLTLLLIPSAGLPGFVRADAPKIRQVLINLLDNAIKNTERGSVTLRLDTGPTDSAGRLRLKFSVEDTGTGIAGEDQEHIFEPFVQIGKPEAHKGTGLGLTITRQFVELMGGRIHLESSLGEGSRFCVELPVERAPDSEAMAQSADGRRIVGLEPGQPEYRILIADDEKQNRTVLQRLIQNAGFSVQVAGDGAQAVDSFIAWRPHFIWMDLRMPVMDGLQATRLIRALDGGREVKIGAISAFAGQRNEVQAGLDDFVRKPYQPGDIFDCMARHLGVRYRYTAPPASLEKPCATLRTEALAALPPELIADLRSALVSLDRKRISETIGPIRERDSDLGSALAHCADRLAFTAIFQAIESCQANTAPNDKMPV